MCARSEVNQSRGCTGSHFDSLKDDPIEICKKLATEARRTTGCEICLIEVFEAESKSSVLFCLETSLPSPGLPFSRFHVRPWSPVSCEGEWSRATVLRPFRVGHISLASSTNRIPKEWIQLRQSFGMESILTYPLSINAQFQSMLGSVTLGHRRPGFFMNSNDSMYRNLSCLSNQFAALAPVTLMKEMSRLVWQMHNSTSVKEQAQFLQSFFTKNTPAISTSFALIDQDCNSAELFIDPNDAEDQTQCKPLENVSIKLQRNTAIWSLHYGGESTSIECSMESKPSSRNLDLDFIFEKKSSTTTSMWILPMRGVALNRNQVPKPQANQGPAVIGLSNNPGSNSNTSRWTGFLGAVYLHKNRDTDFSDSAKQRTFQLIRSLYNLLEKTLRRSEIQPVKEDCIGSSPSPTDLPRMPLGFNRQDFAQQMARAKESERRNAQNYEEHLTKLKIDWLIDNTAANSVVFYGMYNNRPSAVKIVMDASLSREQAFRTRMEHSILASVDHPNIVRLLGSAVKVSGAKVLNTACFGNAKDVEDSLRSKWPQSGSLRSIDLSLFILEYCDKGSLELMIHEERRFQNQGYYNRRDLVLTLLDISEAMEYLHKQGIVHGDLKPANVLVKNCSKGLRRWNCCIADFGSSLRRENLLRPSFRGHGCTLAYRAPEIMSLLDLTVHNRFEDRSRADVYSFGMIIYEIMEGRVPFAGQSGESIIELVREQDRRPKLTSQEPPKALVDLMDRCWAKDPKQRPTFVKITTELKTLLSLEDLAEES